MKLTPTVKRILLLSCILLFAVTMTGCRVPVDEAGQIKLIYPETTFNEIMESESWFGAILVWPLAQALNFLTSRIGVFGALAVVTIVVNAVLLALTLKSNISMQQMQLLQPELDKITRKYEGRDDQQSKMKQANEMNALYKKYNVNPLSSFVSFAQFPVIIAMYQAVQRASVVKSTPFLGLNLNTPIWDGIKSGQYLYLVIFVIMGLCQFLSMMLPQLINKKKAEAEAAKHHRKPQNTSASSQTKFMQYYMVGLIMIFGLMWPAAMSVYWTIYSLVNIAKTLIVQKIIDSKKEVS